MQNSGIMIKRATNGGKGRELALGDLILLLFAAMAAWCLMFLSGIF